MNDLNFLPTEGHSPPPQVTRRRMLAAMGGLGVAGVVAACTGSPASSRPAAAKASPGDSGRNFPNLCCRGKLKTLYHAHTYRPA